MLKRTKGRAESSSSRKKIRISDTNKENSTQNIPPKEDGSIRCGKVVQIHLKNFMCHSNLKIDFCDRVNFIIGSNGSGKSAILTALIIGLGSKAKDTSRSANMKQLIKNGQNAAEIDIVLLNKGPEAFEHDLYGDYITISRRILQSGSSNYKIKDCRGQVVSKKIDMLYKILLFHNIQSDNPVFVLNQEGARTFLRDMNPSKNYTLFLKATQIDVVLEKMNECGVMYKDIKFRLNCMKKHYEFKANELEELQKKRECLEGADQIKKKLDMVNLEIEWLKVKNQEELVKEIDETVKKCVISRDKIKRFLENKNQMQIDLKGVIHQEEIKCQEKTDIFRSKLADSHKLKESYKTACKDLELKTLERQKKESKINECKSHIKCYEERIRECSGSGATYVKNLRTQNEEKLQGFEEAKENTNLLLQQQKQELELLNETKLKQEEEFENLNRSRLRYLDKIGSCEKEIMKITSSSSGKYIAYGAQMTEFIDDINNNAKNFSKMPIGPLGQYIYVLNQKWRGTVEQILGNLLTCFIVDNDKDFKILSKIKSKYKSLRNSIITTRFRSEVYDVRSGSCHAPEDSTLLMNEIRCENPVIMNCLIDRVKIETVLLTENQDLAINLTASEHNVPKHLNRIILLNPFLEYYPAPMFRAYSLNERLPRFIQVDRDEIRRNLENEIKQLKDAKLAAEEQLRKWKTVLSKIYVQVKRNQDKVADYETTLNNIIDSIKELKSYEYPEETRVEFFKNEIVEIKVVLAKEEEEISKIEEQIRISKEKKINEMKIFKDFKTILKSQQEEIDNIKANIDDLKTKLNSLNETKTMNDELETLVQEIKENMNKIGIETDKLSKLRETTEALGARVEVTQSENELKQIKKNYECSLQLLSKCTEKLSDIILEIKEKSSKLQKVKTLIAALEKNLYVLRKSRLQRFKLILNLKNHMALRVKFTFDSVLRIKNFTGDIEFDHPGHALTLSVVPRDKHISNAVSNTKSLSGGERSFSTIALLLSLWSCVDHPFYFLDEYDVFTDQINREIMTKLLLSEANRKPHRQYSFLTPQDVSFVKASDTVVIHKMAEPIR